MGLLILILVFATLLEKLHGSSFVIENIYHSWWFISLWSLLALSAMIYIANVSRRNTLILLHASFLTILFGAFVSFLTSRHGNIIITDTVPASMYTTGEGKLEKLPFSLKLTAIDTLYSNDSGNAIDYNAKIIANNRKEENMHWVSLNNPMTIDGYSFCIKGETDGNLSLLVAYDKYGKPICHLGYLMVFISFLMLFFDKQSGFRNILRKLNDGKIAKRNRTADIHCRNFSRKAARILPIIPILICIQWCNNGTFPITSGVETLFLLALIIAILAFIFKSRNLFPHLPGALITIAGIIAIIATCNIEGENDIQPILRTPLLGIHVTTIIIAYALLFCTAINAIIALCSRNEERTKQLALLGQALLYPATMLLATGIFIGAVWANISWGRYWGWDPKEVWALITLLTCSFAFHTRSLPFLQKPVFFHAYCIIVFVAMLFTYFGVNYLLGGIHSYT